MYFQTEDGLIAGPFDVVTIVKDTSTGRFHVKDTSTGRFHVYVLYESPMPGTGNRAGPNEFDFIRLKSRMHHTEGANTWSAPEQVLEADCSGGFAGVFFTRPWKGRPELPKLMELPVQVTVH